MSRIPQTEEAQMMARFASGNVVLDCSITCSAKYIFNQEQIWEYYRTGDWRSLALAVMKSGWTQDITYYFLGAAAEGMGYLEPASYYYQRAAWLATGSVSASKCGSAAKLCGGFRFPRDIYVRQDAVRKAIVAARRAVPAVAPEHKKGSGWVNPPPVDGPR